MRPGLGALAGHLQLDDRRGEIVLHRAHPRTLARGTIDGRAESENGLVARPLTRGAMNALGHARALLEQSAEPLPVPVLAHDRLDRRCRERPERHRGVAGLLRRGEHQQRAAGDGDALELGSHLRGRVIEIVDDEQGGAPHRAALADHPPRRLGRAGTRGVEHVATVGLDHGGELGRKAGLAHPPRAGNEQLRALAGLRATPVRTQRIQLLPPTLERLADVQLRWQLNRDGEVEGRVLPQDRLVEAAQLRAGLDADRVHELVARPAVGAERVGLAPAAVEGEHAQRVEALAQRLASEDRLGLVDHLCVAARREILLERQLDGAEAQVLEAADLEAGERLGGDVVEGGPRHSASASRASPSATRRSKR